MAYTVIDTNRRIEEITKGSRVSMIDGESYDFYFNSIEPLAHRGRILPRLTGKPEVVIERFLSLSNGQPTFDHPFTVNAQVTWMESEKVDPGSMYSKGKYSKESKLTLIVRASRSQTQKRGLYKITVCDRENSQSYEESHDVVFYKPTTDLDSRGFVSSVVLGDPIVITPSYIRVEDQYRKSEEGILYKYGEAVVGIPMGQVSFEDLCSSSTFFTISTNGGSPVKYSLWNGKAATKQTHDYEVFLRRESIA